MADPAANRAPESPAPASPALRPSPAVWVATALVYGYCLLGLFVGLVLLFSGRAAAAPADPDALVPQEFDPWLRGLFNLLVSALLVWLQFSAVFRRRAVLSFAVGVLFLVFGFFGGVFRHMDLGWGFVIASWLFVGVTMLRWGWRLAFRRADAVGS
jgi:hypothetical protein